MGNLGNASAEQDRPGSWVHDNESELGRNGTDFAVAAWAQGGLEALSHVEGQEGQQ